MQPLPKVIGAQVDVGVGRPEEREQLLAHLTRAYEDVNCCEQRADGGRVLAQLSGVLVGARHRPLPIEAMVDERLEKGGDVGGLQIDEATRGKELPLVDKQLQRVEEDAWVGAHIERRGDRARPALLSLGQADVRPCQRGEALRRRGGRTRRPALAPLTCRVELRCGVLRGAHGVGAVAQRA